MLQIFEERHRVGLLLGASVAIAVGLGSSVSRAGETAHFAAGPAGARATALDLSAAHALVREFGVDSAFAVGDAALARVLADDAVGRGLDRADGGDGAALRALLGRYDDELSDVVALRACSDGLPRARVEARDGVAFVRPGTGAIELPARVELVILDLRDLPSDDALDELLARAVAPALATDVARPSRLVRVHDGPVDEVNLASNVYSTSVAFRDEPVIAASGTHDLPLVLWLGTRVSPQVASFAAALRAAGRAWIAGADVPLEIAESTWQGVGSSGVMVRTSDLATLAPGERSASNGEVAPGALYVEDLEVTPDTTWRISLSALADDDLDLYLLRDDNGDGAFEDNEIVLFSTTSNAEESFVVIGAVLPAALYQLVVLGGSVGGEAASFTLARERVLVTRLPDVIRADLSGRLEQGRDAAALRGRLAAAAPPPLTGPAERSRPLPINPFGFRHPDAEGRGELRADLLITHGVLRLFFPYRSEVDGPLDARLLETLGAVDAYSGDDAFVAGQILRRFGEVLHDGHQFTNAPLSGSPLPVFLEYVGQRPIVRRSLVEGIRPGDTIIALDGRPIEDAYAEERARTSAATEPHELALAELYVFATGGASSLTLEDPDGVQRIVTVEPQPFEAYSAVNDAVESDRPSGMLADLGAPDLYYFNVNTASLPSPELSLQALEEANAAGARGMVLDVRGYPGGFNHYDLAARLIQQPFLSPEFEFRRYVGPGEPTAVVDQYRLGPLAAPAFEGPIVLVTGPHAVSAAENFMQTLVGSGRVLAVVGRRSAGTNGNITGVTLPGGFVFTYTGMEVRNPDGSRFFGVGIAPDLEVPILAEDLRDGVDRALLEAVDVLRDAAPVSAP